MEALHGKYRDPGDPTTNSSSAPCIDIDYIEHYWNRPDVQEAFHVSGKYEGCSNRVGNGYSHTNDSYLLYLDLIS